MARRAALSLGRFGPSGGLARGQIGQHAGQIVLQLLHLSKPYHGHFNNGRHPGGSQPIDDISCDAGANSLLGQSGLGAVNKHDDRAGRAPHGLLQAIKHFAVGAFADQDNAIRLELRKRRFLKRRREMKVQRAYVAKAFGHGNRARLVRIDDQDLHDRMPMERVASRLGWLEKAHPRLVADPPV